MTRLVICAALGVEARAVGRLRARRGGRPGRAAVRVVRTGMGPRRAEAAAARLPEFDALVVAGFGGALDARLRPGDLVVATEVRSGGRTLRCHWAGPLARLLALSGATVHRGPIVTAGHTVTGAERGALAATGAVAVDMESGPLVEAAGARPWAVVRAIVDTPRHPLVSPGTVPHGLNAWRRLWAAGPALSAWAAAAHAAEGATAAPPPPRPSPSAMYAPFTPSGMKATEIDLPEEVGP
ncbi:phosphorylase family protein [Spirillospora sp. NBC_01491]|uniref:phosphorylase family protein n=1 Tax=Spirillospora sp. NBC_01491 TaxID=2976007 RepID=UPI002E2F9C3D|nr:hypothetical protein [Spirillospora sp. NBC_01491]